MTKQTLLVKNITVNNSNAANITKNQTKNVTAAPSKSQQKTETTSNTTSMPVLKTEQEDKAHPKSHINDTRAERVEIIQTQTNDQLKKLHKSTTVLNSISTMFGSAMHFIGGLFGY